MALQDHQPPLAEPQVQATCLLRLPEAYPHDPLRQSVVTSTAELALHGSRALAWSACHPSLNRLRTTGVECDASKAREDFVSPDSAVALGMPSPASVATAAHRPTGSVRREADARRSPLAVTSGALYRFATWLGRGRRARRREREEAARRASSSNPGQASRQLALEMLTEVRGLIAAHHAEAGSDAYRAASQTGSADGTTSAMYGSSATSTGSVSGAAAAAANGQGSTHLAPPPVHVPMYEDRSRTSVGSWSSASTASAAASGGPALTTGAIRAARARRRVSMDVDAGSHIVIPPRLSSRHELSSPPPPSPRRTRQLVSSRSGGRQLNSRPRHSSVRVRPLPPLELRVTDADSSTSEDDYIDAPAAAVADERRELLNSIVELLNLGSQVRDTLTGDVVSDSDRRGGIQHLLRRFPTFSVEKGQVVAGTASCPICLDALSDTIMLLPCLCSGHEGCMKVREREGHKMWKSRNFHSHRNYENSSGCLSFILTRVFFFCILISIWRRLRCRSTSDALCIDLTYASTS